jgi:CheY-like chemotaxis protein
MSAVKLEDDEAAVRRMRSESLILVVDDDPDILELAVETLCDQGYAVVTAVNGWGALKMLGVVEEIDLLFTDLVMSGGLSGLDLADRATSLRPDLRVLLTSGYPNHPLLADRPGKPAEAFIGKPYRTAALVAKIRSLLGA